MKSTARHAFLADLIRQCHRHDWVVYAKRPFGGPEHVLPHLGNYTHRIAISNHRLVTLTDGNVRFRWRDSAHKNKKRVMALKGRGVSPAFLSARAPAWFRAHPALRLPGEPQSAAPACTLPDAPQPPRSPVHRCRLNRRNSGVQLLALSRLWRHDGHNRAFHRDPNLCAPTTGISGGPSNPSQTDSHAYTSKRSRSVCPDPMAGPLELGLSDQSGASKSLSSAHCSEQWPSSAPADASSVAQKAPRGFEIP